MECPQYPNDHINAVSVATTNIDKIKDYNYPNIRVHACNILNSKFLHSYTQTTTATTIFCGYLILNLII